MISENFQNFRERSISFTAGSSYNLLKTNVLRLDPTRNDILEILKLQWILPKELFGKITVIRIAIVTTGTSLYQLLGAY